MDANRISIELVERVDDDVRELIAALDATLAQSYAPEQRHGLSLDALFRPHVRFFIARRDGVAVGCGGFAVFPSFGEVKRMFVREDARGRGVARALLHHIERCAADAGLGVLRLETGDRQFDAIRLYERAGFRPCAAFGDYAAMPPEDIVTSRFFEKHLDLPHA